jgi:uncharacterized membrane protein YoaK (UPF0700 family)
VGRLSLDNAVLLGISIAGTIGAVKDGAPGFVVLFVVVGAAVALAVARPRRRRALAVRADLAAWLDEVSATTGEPIGAILDRSVSAYRAAMGSDDGA